MAGRLTLVAEIEGVFAVFSLRISSFLASLERNRLPHLPLITAFSLSLSLYLFSPHSPSVRPPET